MPKVRIRYVVLARIVCLELGILFRDDKTADFSSIPLNQLKQAVTPQRILQLTLKDHWLAFRESHEPHLSPSALQIKRTV